MKNDNYAFAGNRVKLRGLFTAEKLWFPLIVSVIEQNQSGVIFANDALNPTHAFVVNKFGFCQEAYEKYDEAFFTKEIRPYIESSERIKLRMYYPGKYMQDYLASLPYAAKSTRVHMQYRSGETDIRKISPYPIREMKKNEVINDDFGLELADRYYEGADDFIDKANAVAAYSDKGDIIGIAYSAGEALDVCEKDIFVKPEFRGKGVGKGLTAAFIHKCDKQNKLVSEDIYENNYASIALAKAAGAEMIRVYDYFNIEKR